MEELVQHIVYDSEKLFFTLVAITFVFISTVQAIASIFKSMAKERTKREIAAYIAEGSISAEQGERLIRAKPTKSGLCSSE